MTTLTTILLAIAGACVLGLLLWRRRPPAGPDMQPAATPDGPLRVRTAIQSFGANTESLDVAPEDAAHPASAPPAALQSFTLLRRDSARDAEEPGVFQTLVEAIPEPHAMFLQVTGELDDIDEITEAVKNEPALAADVLRTVNSAAFALTTPIASVHHAIAYLGVSYVKGLIAQSALARTLPASAPGSEQEAAMRRLWKSSQVASATAFLLARNLNLENPSVASTQALLANLGDINLLSLQPELAPLYAPGCLLLERVQGQQAALGANAAMFAALLARRWGLPANIEAALEQSLLPLAVPPAEHPLQGPELATAAVVYTACRLGDAALFQGLKDVAGFSLGEERPVELHYIPAYLEAADVQRLEATLQDSATRRAINRTLTAAAS